MHQENSIHTAQTVFIHFTDCHFSSNSATSMKAD